MHYRNSNHSTNKTQQKNLENPRKIIKEGKTLHCRTQKKALLGANKRIKFSNQ